MSTWINGKAIAMAVAIMAAGWSVSASEGEVHKIAPDAALQQLKDGNARFIAGKSTHPNADAARIIQADKEDQGKYAFATILSCSDSRVPVELIFDTGIMDIFVVRDAGNISGPDATASIEYGICHVHTPVLVILGHSRCGAVTTVTKVVNGKIIKLEKNIPPLVNNIVPAVKRAQANHSDVHGDALIPYATEENVWLTIEDLLLKSPATREMVKSGKLKIAGAVYDLATGKVNWLPEDKVAAILKNVEKNPKKVEGIFAEK